MNIIQLAASTDPRYGGPATAVQGIAKSLADRGHAVTVIAGLERSDQLRDTALDEYETVMLPRGWPRGFYRLRGLRATLRRRLPSADVVHIHGLYLHYHLLARRECQRANVPYIVRPHGILEPYQRRQSRWKKWPYDVLFGKRYLRDAAACQFTHESERDRALDLVDDERSWVVGLGVDLIDERDVEIQPPWWPGGDVIAYVSRLAPKKRAELLVQAMPAVLQRVPTARLVLAGPSEGGARERLIAEAQRLGVYDSVTFPGLVTGKSKEYLLAHSRVFCLPSDNENFGLAVAEAMASGLPIVTTTGVALHDLVVEYKAGHVLSEVTPATLAAAITALLEADELRAQAANASRAAAQTLSWDAVAMRLEEMYRSTLPQGPTMEASFGTRYSRNAGSS
jgi:glycosyltransferase involved in cell wall biosynthesis